MMVLQPDIKIKSEAVERKLAEMVDRTKDQSKPLAESAQIMLKSVMRNFKEEGRPTKWKPLAESTKANRRVGRRKGGGHQILQDTGQHIKNRITAESDAHSARVGVDGVIPMVHQFGAIINLPEIHPVHAKALKIYAPNAPDADSRGFIFRKRVKAHSVTIPARPFLLFQDEDVKRILERFRLHNFER